MRPNATQIPAVVLLLIVLGAGCDRPPPAPAEEADEASAREEEPAGEESHEASSPETRVVYVPAYSQIPAERGRDMPFAVTLSVRNVDPSATITLDRVDYYDTSGRRVRRYLPRARTLRPLQTAEFAVGAFDESGGSGANFLIYWRGPPEARPLLTETVMIGHVSTGYVAFTSRGVELERPPSPTADAPAPTPTEPG